MDNRFKDGNYEQTFTMLFDDMTVFDSSFGDFVEGSISIDQYFCTDTDLTPGSVPSDLISCSVSNRYGLLNNYDFGWADVMIGIKEKEVQGEKISNYPTCETEHGITGKVTLISTGNVLYKEYYNYAGEKKREVVYSGTCLSFIYIHKHHLTRIYSGTSQGESEFVYVYNGDNNVVCTKTMFGWSVIGEWSVSDKMKFMFQKNTGIIFENPEDPEIGKGDYKFGYSVCVVDEDTVTETEYLSYLIGRFKLDKPSVESGFSVNIEGNDGLKELDVDASEFLKGITTFPVGVNKVIDDILLEYDLYSETSLMDTTPVYNDTLKNGQYTLRDILSYFAEKNAATFRRFGENRVELRQMPQKINMISEVLTDNYIMQGSFTAANYITQSINRINIKTINGSNIVVDAPGKSASAPTIEANIYGNPFIYYAEWMNTGKYFNMMNYNPVDCTVLMADPSIEIGSVIEVDIPNPFNGDIISYIFPLMHRVIKWNGICIADYSATGNKEREIQPESDSVFYSAQSGMNVGRMEYIASHDSISFSGYDMQTNRYSAFVFLLTFGGAGHTSVIATTIIPTEIANKSNNQNLTNVVNYGNGMNASCYFDFTSKKVFLSVAGENCGCEIWGLVG